MSCPPCAARIINSFVAHVRKLEYKATSPEARANHLAWIFHQVGDVHMPLHAVARFSKALPNGDRGGNAVKSPKPRGRGNRSGSLHAYWDGLLGAKDSPAEIEQVAGDLIATHPRAMFTEELKRTDIGEWAEESVAICLKTVYRDLDPNITSFADLPVGYEADAVRMARRRSALAGYRLADQIKRTLSGG